MGYNALYISECGYQQPDIFQFAKDKEGLSKGQCVTERKIPTMTFPLFISCTVTNCSHDLFPQTPC
jgi:hypothetical protein